jgi:hypothetical protein
MVALKVMRTVSTVFCIVFLRSLSLRDAGSRSTVVTNAEECVEGNREECGTVTCCTCFTVTWYSVTCFTCLLLALLAVLALQLLDLQLPQILALLTLQLQVRYLLCRYLH